MKTAGSIVRVEQGDKQTKKYMLILSLLTTAGFGLLITDTWLFQKTDKHIDWSNPAEVPGLIISAAITIAVEQNRLQKYWPNLVVVLIAALTSALSYAYYTSADPFWSLGYVAIMIIAPAIYIMNSGWFAVSVTIPWLGWIIPYSILLWADQNFDIKPPLLTSIFATALSVAIHSLLTSKEKQTVHYTELLAHRAYYDHLTGVLNRAGIAEMLKTVKLSNVGLMFIDITGLKKINDTFGHTVGDLAIQQVTLALRTQAKNPNTILGRWGGDEFVMIMPGTVYNEKEFKEKINSVLDLDYNGQKIPLGVSVGVSCSQKETSFDKLLKKADENTYRNKLEKKVL